MSDVLTTDDRLPDEIAIEAAEAWRKGETSEAEPSNEEETAGAGDAGEEGEPGDGEENAGAGDEEDTSGEDIAEAEGEGGDDEEEDGEKRLSKNQRRNLRLRRAEDGLAAATAKIAALERQMAEAEKTKGDDDTPPKLEDFNDDYDAWEEAKEEHRIRKAMRKQSFEDRTASTRAELNEIRNQRLALAKEQFEIRAETAKPTMPDYDEKVSAMIDDLVARKIGIQERVVDAIHRDVKGPEVLYLMATDEGFRNKILTSDEVDAVAEIARRSATLSASQRKTKSTAPAPHRPLKGGGQPDPDPSTMSYAQYRKWRGFDTDK